jgi:hypothetical protein
MPISSSQARKGVRPVDPPAPVHPSETAASSAPESSVALASVSAPDHANIVPIQGNHPSSDVRTAELNARFEAQSVVMQVVEQFLDKRRVDQTKRNSIRSYVSRIHATHHQAKELFVKMGEDLLRLHETAPDLYEEITKTKGILPFNHTQALKYRMVALAVRNGKLSLNELPSTIRTAYELANLSDSERGAARELKLIHPEVRYTEIVSLKRTMRQQSHDMLAGDVEDSPQLRRLYLQKARLEVRKQELSDALIEANADIAEVQEQIEALRKSRFGNSALLIEHEEADEITHASESENIAIGRPSSVMAR